MAFIHQERAIVHDGLVVIKQLHLHHPCPGPAHFPAVEQTGGGWEVAQSGAGVVFEDSDGGSGAFQVGLDDLAEPMDGGGVGHLQ